MPKKLDLTGNKYGHLTVIRRVDSKSKYLTWECRCDCGNTICVDSRHLRSGATVSCGCEQYRKIGKKRGRPATDLRGRTFGRLTVLERVENREGLVTWKCQCSCGNVTLATAHDLNFGLKKSCGCLKKSEKKRLDITGQRFGKLVALYSTKRKGESGSMVWRCRCDCGNEVNVNVSDLRKGNNKSCGCLKIESQKMVHDRLHITDGTCIEWLDGRKKRCDNSSGFRGVHKKKNGKYVANIGFKKKIYYLGTFDEYEDAVEIRKKAEKMIHAGFLEAYRLWEKKAEDDPEWGRNNPLVFEVQKQNGVLTIQNSMAEYMKKNSKTEPFVIDTKLGEESGMVDTALLNTGQTEEKISETEKTLVKV